MQWGLSQHLNITFSFRFLHPKFLSFRFQHHILVFYFKVVKLINIIRVRIVELVWSLIIWNLWKSSMQSNKHLIFETTYALFNKSFLILYHSLQDSPVVPLGKSPRTDVLLKAEKVVLDCGGTVLRLAGLYISFWILKLNEQILKGFLFRL